MLLRKILILVSAIFLLFYNINVSASPDIVFESTAIKGYTYYIGGNTNADKSENVRMCITIQNEILYADETTSDSNGDFKFKLYIPEIAGEKTDASIRISYDSATEVSIYPIVITDVSYLNRLIVELNGLDNMDEIYSALKENYLILGLEEKDITEFFAKILVEEEFLNAEEFDEIKNIVLLYNGLMSDITLDNWKNTNSFISDDVLDDEWFSDMSDAEADKVYENLRNSVYGLSYDELESKTSLDKEFRESIVITLLDNISTADKNDVFEIIKDFADVLSADENDLEGYSDREIMKICDAFVNCEISDIESINDLYQKTVDSFSSSSSSSSSGSGSSGSSSGGSKKQTYAPSAVTVIPVNRFSDVSSSHWAYEAVEYMAENNIINGYADGSFKPDRSVTREEFVKMLSVAMGLSGEKELPFNDCDDKSWYAPYISSAYESGIVNGISETLFGIGEKIIRQDMAVMIYRCAEYAGVKLSKGDINFTDKNDVAEYALDAVSVLGANKLVNGDENGRFLPYSNATRAHAAQMIYNLTKARDDN